MDTKKYFNDNLPEYSLARFDLLLEYLESEKRPLSLIEIGAGSGKNLSYLVSKNNLLEASGIEEAENYLSDSKDEIKRKIFKGSVLDDNFIKSIGRKFDIVLIPYLLHHLVGSNPAASKRQVSKAIKNCSLLLKENGRLIVIEPTISPQIFNRGLFYLKKTVSRFSSKRVGIFGYWNNIGVPIVNYLTRPELEKIIGSIMNIVETKNQKTNPNKLQKSFINRTDTFLVAKND